MAQGVRSIEVRFPLAGLARQRAYAQTQEPYTTPYARNVRSVGALERRGRGGSRPMLAKYVSNDFGSTITAMSKVSYQDGDGNHQLDLVVIADGNMNVVRGSFVTTTIAYLATDDGDLVTTDSGDNIIFDSTVAAVNPIGYSDAFHTAEHNGKLYVAGSTLQVYNPATGLVDVVANAPTNQPLVAVYRERIVLGGADHILYMCRSRKPTDWNFVDRPEDKGKAVAIGMPDTTLFLAAWRDTALIAATNDELWVFYGNPGGDGRRRNISHEAGMIAPRGACITPGGMLVFLARDGLYTWQIGSEARPEPFSPRRVPDEMRDIDPSVLDVTMEYDHKNRGIHLFLTPAATAGEHWWIDIDNKALWPVIFGNNNHQPIATAVLPQSGDSDVLLGCKDGYIREFSNSATTDDGTAMNSDLFLGPFRLGDIRTEGMITEMIGAMADNTVGMTWRLYKAATAEEVTDNAVADLDGGTTTYQHSSGTWGENRNDPEFPRTRGAWGLLWLDAAGKWSYESIIMKLRKCGKIRRVIA